MIDSFNSLDQLATKRANTITQPDIDKTYAEKPKIKVLKAERGKRKRKKFNPLTFSQHNQLIQMLIRTVLPSNLFTQVPRFLSIWVKSFIGDYKIDLASSRSVFKGDASQFCVLLLLCRKRERYLRAYYD